MMKKLLLLINLILPLALFSQTATQVFVTGSTGAYSISNNVASVVDPGIVVTANGNITNFTVSETYALPDYFESIEFHEGIIVIKCLGDEVINIE